MMLSELDGLKNKALLSLRDGDLEIGQKYLADALRIDFEDPEIIALLKYSKFWSERLLHIENIQESLEKADSLIETWKHFKSFTHRVGLVREEAMFPFRFFVFGMVFESLKSYNSSIGIKNPEIIWRMGLSLKMTGNYEHALRILSHGYKIDQNNSTIIAELADVYALLEVMDESKLLFREAFYIDPSKIKITTLESALIHKIIELSKNKAINERVVPFWVPIMGKLSGVFTITRELKLSEIGKLKQNIYEMEREYVTNPNKDPILVPKLINSYFWYLDHAQYHDFPKNQIQSILMKIQSLDADVFKLYTN